MPYLRYCAGMVALALSGCGLISSDVTNFDLTLPDKSFSIDTASWQVDPTAAMAFTSTTCDSSQPPPNLCSSAAMQACPMNCTGTCASSNTCQLALDVSVYNPVNLEMEKPELKTINDQPVIKVTIDSVTYDVTDNSLNIDTPAMTVYVAPMSVTSSTDPKAVAIGTIEPVPAGTTATGKEMHYTAAGKQALIDVMSTFKTPFNVIVGGQLVITKDTPVPMGKLDAVVHIKAHAGV